MMLVRSHQIWRELELLLVSLCKQGISHDLRVFSTYVGGCLCNYAFCKITPLLSSTSPMTCTFSILDKSKLTCCCQNCITALDEWIDYIFVSGFMQCMSGQALFHIELSSAWKSLFYPTVVPSEFQFSFPIMELQIRALSQTHFQANKYFCFKWKMGYKVNQGFHAFWLIPSHS